MRREKPTGRSTKETFVNGSRTSRKEENVFEALLYPNIVLNTEETNFKILPEKFRVFSRAPNMSIKLTKLNRSFP